MSGSISNVTGSGSDTITLTMSEDQAQGEDAQFSVNVDGQQIGGLQTVTAAKSSGQDQTFSFQGDYAPGAHNLTVTFANNFIYPGLSGDRNLYIDGVTYDGQTVSDTTTPIYVSPLYPPNSNQGDYFGNAVFSINDTTPVPNGAPPTATTTPGAVSIGGGPDNLVLNMAEDPYQGDAQFTVAVDGQQIGGTQTTTAIVSQGQQQEFDVHGNFGGGSHSVTVDFLNDQIGAFYPPGTPGVPAGQQWAVDTTDRNLYVMSVRLNGGTPASGTPWELSSDGSFTWNVTSGPNAAAPADQAASATSGTAAITADSLAPAPDQAAMSFVAGSSIVASTTASVSRGVGLDVTSSTSAAIVGATNATAQDFSVASMLGSSGTDTTATAAGSGVWWTGQPAATIAGAGVQQNI